MIRILSITVYDATNSNMLDYEAFIDKSLADETAINQWKIYLEAHYSEIFNTPVKVYVVRRKKPKKELNMMDVLRNTCDVMGENIEDVISKARTRRFVDVRKITCQILSDADYNPLAIEKELPFKNRVVYNYLTSMQNRFKTEKRFKNEYLAIRSEVMELSLNGEKP